MRTASHPVPSRGARPPLPHAPAPAAPSRPPEPREPASQREVDEIFAREEEYILRAKTEDGIKVRWVLIITGIPVTALVRWFDLLTISYEALFGLALAVSAVNVLFTLALRTGAWRPWLFWAAILTDVLVLCGFTAAHGPYGMLMMPYFVGLGSYPALGAPRGGMVSAALALVLYPASRVLGAAVTGTELAAGMIFLETLVVVSVLGAALLVPTIYTRRLLEVRRALHAVSEGDFRVSVKAANRDQMDFLAAAVNRLAGSLGGVVKEVQGQSRSLAALAEELSATAEEVQASAVQVGSIASEAAGEVERELALVARGGETLERLAQRNRSLREGASEAASDARRLTGQTDVHVTRIGQTATLLEEVSEGYRRSAAAMDALASSGERIGGFVSAIREIADQTNLLALNAAIEAARAGEHGRGFAVVADEVRKLAGQSGTSAAQVSGVVSDTREAIGRVRKQLDQADSSLTRVGAASSDGRAALEEMVAGLRSAIDAIERIHGEVEAQAGVVEELLGAMHRVQEIVGNSRVRTEQTASAAQDQTAAMEELADASQNLAGMALSLDSLAGRFRV